MRALLSLCSLLACAAFVGAQERINPETAQRYAKVLSESAAKVADPQLKTEADPDKPFGIKKDEHGILIIPDAKLSLDAIKSAGKKIVPIGQLWMRNVSPAVDGKAASAEQVRTVSVNVEGQEHMLPLYFLGVRQNDAKALELVVFAKDKKPLVVAPISAADNQQEMPLELTAQKGENEAATLSILILGKYKAPLSVTH